VWLEREHQDVTYYKRDEIGVVLSKGLSETYRLKPNKPIEFFAKWLINFSDRQKKDKQNQDRNKAVKDSKDKFKYFKMADEAELKEKQEELEVKNSKITTMFT